MLRFFLGNQFLTKRTIAHLYAIGLSLNYKPYINPLKLKLALITFNNSVRTAKKTPHFTIRKINFLTLFKEIITVYIENHTKHKNKNADLLIVKAGGTSSYHQPLKD
jgi:hypothetical protein